MRAAAWVIGLWLAGHVVLVLLSVLEVFLYSLVVAPGLEHSAYEAHAQLTAPWVSIVCGGPVFFAWGRLLRARVAPGTDRRAAAAVWGLYTATDAAIVTASAAWVGVLPVLWLTSQTVKAIGIAWGVRPAR